jgi:hypothetical protein
VFSWYWRNCWPSLLKLSSGLLILEEFSTITVKTFFWFVDIGRIFDHHQKKVLTVMVNNFTNINKPKESLNSDGQQFYQYQQTKRRF